MVVVGLTEVVGFDVATGLTVTNDNSPSSIPSLDAGVDEMGSDAGGAGEVVGGGGVVSSASSSSGDPNGDETTVVTVVVVGSGSDETTKVPPSAGCSSAVPDFVFGRSVGSIGPRTLIKSS